jgi:hypothetical protein
MKDSNITLEWINKRPEGVDELVIADIRSSLAHPESPAHLGFHTVFLGNDTDPGVVVTIEPGNPSFICEYFAVIGEDTVAVQPNAHPAIDVFLRDRGDEKAQPSGEDFSLGHNAIRDETEQQDKGA